MTAERLLARRLLFFGGKGGVGKTTLASAFALYAAARGDRTLLVSTDPAHSTGDLFDTTIGAGPTPVAPGLDVLEIDPEAEADAYVRDVKDRLADTVPPRLVAEVERQIDVARLTPGAEDAAVFERFARIIEQDGGSYARLVFDTAPLGHTLRLLALPEQMYAWMDALVGRRRRLDALARMWRRVAGSAASGPPRRDAVLGALEERRRRFERARVVLTDAAQCAFVFVVTPERLPILETERAARALTRFGIPIGGVIVNRVIPEEGDGAFLDRRRERERAYLDMIRDRLRGQPIWYVALQEEDVAGPAALHALFRALH